MIEADANKLRVHEVKLLVRSNEPCANACQYQQATIEAISSPSALFQYFTVSIPLIEYLRKYHLRCLVFYSHWVGTAQEEFEPHSWKLPRTAASRDNCKSSCWPRAAAHKFIAVSDRGENRPRCYCQRLIFEESCGRYPKEVVEYAPSVWISQWICEGWLSEIGKVSNDRESFLLTLFISLWRCASSRERPSGAPPALLSKAAEKLPAWKVGTCWNCWDRTKARPNIPWIDGTERSPEHETQPNAHSVWMQFSNAAVSAYISFEDLFGRPREMASMDHFPPEDERVERLKASISVHPGRAGTAIALLGLLCNQQKSKRHWHGAQL